MTLKEKLMNDRNQAMRDNDKLHLSLVRMILAEVKNVEIEKRQEELSDEDVLGIIAKQHTELKDTLNEYFKVGVNDSNKEEIDKHHFWISKIQNYLPEPMSEDEVRSLIQSLIKENSFTGMKDMKAIMPLMMPQIKGRYDGKMASEMVKKELQNL